MDSKPLFSNKHTNIITSWYKKLWSWLKYWFIRPKLSESNLQKFHVGFDLGSSEGDMIIYRILENGVSTMYTKEEFDKKYK